MTSHQIESIAIGPSGFLSTAIGRCIIWCTSLSLVAALSFYDPLGTVFFTDESLS